jgi:Tfp pilus assembly protein PilV
MVVVLIIAVAVLGAMSFRFYSTVDAKKADVQVNAARIGSMILENWKGTGGLPAYNPVTQFGTLFSSHYTITGPAGGKYTVLDKSNNVYYYVVMTYQTEAIAIPAGVTVNVPVLNVAISWNQKYDDQSAAARVLSMTAYAD